MRVLLSIAILAACPLGALAQTAVVAAPEEVAIEGVGLSQDVPCEGRAVGIYGADNRITLTGSCGRVVVHGDGHNVTIENAAALAVSGIGHTVLAEKLGALAIETTDNTVTATMASTDGSADITVSGADQVANLTLESAAKIAVSGTQQTVNWSIVAGTPEPTVDIDGIDNAVNRIDGLD